MHFPFRPQRSGPPAANEEGRLLRRFRSWRSRRLAPGLARAIGRRRVRIRLTRIEGGGFGPHEASRASLVWGLVVIVLIVFAVMLTAALRPRVVSRPAVKVSVQRF
ncbi:MAG: hypothetical protein HY320_02490 [Armatimonadetes bacterium]|nr:hypothetical protein [Armatimonadota bacterium]